MRTVPFWVDDYPRPTDLTTSLPSESDIVVIGSGLTGLSASLRLVSAGSSVTVLDAGDIGGGASSVNGGMVSPDVKAGAATVYRRFGPAVGREVWDASVRSVEIISEIASRHGVDAQISRGGMTGLGIRDSDFARFSSRVDWYRAQFGVKWEALDREELGKVVGESDHFTAAIYEPEGIGVHPARLVFGLARSAANHGVALVDQTAALAVESTASGHRVTTSRGIIRAGQVIVATNGYTTSEPYAKLARKIVPVGSYIIITEPIPEGEAKAIFPTNSMSYTSNRLLSYMRRSPDNRILLGGRRNLKTGLNLEESALDLRRRLVRYWPILEDKQITHVWGGKLGVPFDLMPHIGRIDGAWYAMGYAGHGVGLSTLLGHDLAGMILGEDPPSVFSKIPHRGRWYYRGDPWFLAPASLMYRTLDRFGI